VTIAGTQASTGAMHLTLGWSNQPTDPRSVRAGIKRSTDVHFGCLWEMTNGESGVIQSLGDGSDHAPGHGSTVLRLGPRGETGGETLTLALAQARRLKRLVLFVYAYSRTPEWGPLAPVLVVELKGATVEMRLDREADIVDAAEPAGSVCVLASLHRVGGDLVLRREAEMLYGQQSVAAEAFGWDLVWADGRTVPPPRTVR
jgi:tellurite resistance protein TerA